MTVIRFYKDGRLHRDDGPAVIWRDGAYSPDESNEPYEPYEPYELKEWWINGSLIRCDFTYFNSSTASYWFKDGEHHREDGPAISFSYGYEEWRVDGELHRIGGPAMIWSTGTKEWRVNGNRHREDGPAVIHASGEIEWWINGKRRKGGWNERNSLL